VLLPELVRVHVRAMRRHFGCSGLLVAAARLPWGWVALALVAGRQPGQQAEAPSRIIS